MASAEHDADIGPIHVSSQFRHYVYLDERPPYQYYYPRGIQQSAGSDITLVLLAGMDAAESAFSEFVAAVRALEHMAIAIWFPQDHPCG